MKKHGTSYRAMKFVALPLLLSGLALAQETKVPATEAAAAPAAKSNDAKPTPAGGTGSAWPVEYTEQGVKLQMTFGSARAEGARDVIEQEEATVRFRLTDAAGMAITGARPSVWFDQRAASEEPSAQKCHDKIQGFLQASLGARPTADLNSYYVLALNDEPNISVIDPILGFGNSKLFTLVLLKAPGADWALTADGHLLFVSMPEASAVAVVDTDTWKVLANIDVQGKPGKIGLQPDNHYLWVAIDGDPPAASAVAAIDVGQKKVAARIVVGQGHHEIAFDSDSRYAFVTNRIAGTVSVIDVRRIAKVGDFKAGLRPSGVSFSAKSRKAYVANQGDGSITVIDGATPRVAGSILAHPGIKWLRFSPDGRWGFAANVRRNSVVIVDASTDRVLETVSVPRGPDQVTFSRDYAYVRSLGSDQVTMIPLAGLNKGASIHSLVSIPGGQIAPEKANVKAGPDAIVPAPEPGSVLIANAADHIIYYYTEGMAAAMGSFQNYGRAPRAVLVVDRSLRETSPGSYVGRVKLPNSGKYDVAFLLDSPRVVHCFDVAVKPNPEIEKKKEVAIRIEPVLADRKLRVGEPFRVQFKVSDTQTGKPRADLRDLQVLAFRAPGVWQQRQWAKPLGDGLYEITFSPPGAGAYFVFWQCPSLKIRYNQLPSLSLMAADEKPVAPQGSPETK